MLLLQVDGTYSEEARLRKISGSVLVSVIIDADGMPRDPKIVHPLELGLDQKALKAVTMFRFRPATKEGRPIAV